MAIRKVLLATAFGGVAFLCFNHVHVPFAPPLVVTASRDGSGEVRFDFDTLRGRGTRLENLAQPGFYTVVEAYIDTCSVCRALECDLEGFMVQRHDVVLRHVRFDERGGLRIQATSERAARAQVEAYAAQLKSYRAFHVAEPEGGPVIGTCGTPHVEVYGPDGTRFATDSCGTRADKSGLLFLRQWIAAERAL